MCLIFQVEKSLPEGFQAFVDFHHRFSVVGPNYKAGRIGLSLATMIIR